MEVAERSHVSSIDDAGIRTPNILGLSIPTCFSEIIRAVACRGGGAIIPKINTGIATWYLLSRHCPPPRVFGPGYGPDNSI